MSKLSGLKGKSKVYQIGEIELEIKPLSLADMDLMNISEKLSPKEQQEETIKLITKTLKDSVSDATDEEIKNIGVQYMEELTNAIMDVNGLKENNKRANLLKDRIDAIKSKQNQE